MRARSRRSFCLVSRSGVHAESDCLPLEANGFVSGVWPGFVIQLRKRLCCLAHSAVSRVERASPFEVSDHHHPCGVYSRRYLQDAARRSAEYFAGKCYIYRHRAASIVQPDRSTVLLCRDSVELSENSFRSVTIVSDSHRLRSNRHHVGRRGQCSETPSPRFESKQTSAHCFGRGHL